MYESLYVLLPTGKVLYFPPRGGRYITVATIDATIKQLSTLQVSVYDRSSILGKVLSLERAKHHVRDGLNTFRPMTGKLLAAREVTCPECANFFQSKAQITAACRECGATFFVPGGRVLRLKQMAKIRSL